MTEKEDKVEEQLRKRKKERKRKRKMGCKERKIREGAEAQEKPEQYAGEEREAVREKLLFGVDSDIWAGNMLQNHLTAFEWATRNKQYPNFWGRRLTGENRLTKEEIRYLHDRGCKIAPIYHTEEGKETAEQGKLLAKKIGLVGLELGIAEGTAIFLEVGENEKATRDFMCGFAESLMTEGLTPGFKANTDSLYGFDREYSRGMQSDRALFGACLIWAVAPSLAEFERTTTTHLIHPDEWIPYAPSGITRGDIAIWQYGRECHPIHDDVGREMTFNVNLVRNEKVIVGKMF